MIPFSGRCEHDQYVSAKPYQPVLKNFVLAAQDGVVLDFDIYAGKDTLPQDVMNNLELGAGIVRKLCHTIDVNCMLYTDRLFTSLKLSEHLLQKKKDIFKEGTVILTNWIGTVAQNLQTLVEKTEQKNLHRSSSQKL